MSSVVLKKYDELIRCTNVLTEGIELEFHKFAAHQESCRKKWHKAEEDNHEAKKFMTKYKGDQDTLEVKLKMARHQLDSEIKRRLKAEQAVDHMARQLELIKELLLDKDMDKQSLAQSIYQYSKTDIKVPEKSIHVSYSYDDSAVLPDSEYDDTNNEILDYTGGSVTGDRRRSKRGRPSAPPLQLPTSTDETSEESDHIKRSRVSQEVHRTLETRNFTSRVSTSPSKYQPPLKKVEKQFERPPRPEKRPPSKTHVREFVGSTTSLTESDETDDKETEHQPAQRTFSFTRQHSYGRQQIQHKQEIEKKATMTQHHTVSNLYPSLDALGTPPKKKYNTLSNPKSTKNVLAHNFVTKIAVRMETCGPCNKKLRFGSNVAKCKECKAVCHPECKEKVPVPCYPTKDTPAKKEGTVECYVENKKNIQVPDLVTQCIEEIEQRGLKEQGLYRIPGVDKDVKELKERFLRKKNPDLHKIIDTHVLCGCVKDFLRGLSEPLVTYSLHESFMEAAGANDPDDRLSAMYQCVSELPKANQETLAYIMVHLQRVACSTETQMNISNLSKVFGPTLVGHRSANPSHIEMLEDTKNQPTVVSCLLEMPTDYWNQFLNSNSTHITSKTPPYNPNFQGTLNTPERREAPESRLGPIDPNGVPKNTKKTYNAMTPKVASKDGKRPRHFFNSPS